MVKKFLAALFAAVCAVCVITFAGCLGDNGGSGDTGGSNTVGGGNSSPSTPSTPSKPSTPTNCAHDDVVKGFDEYEHYYICKNCGEKIDAEAHDFSKSASDCSVCEYHKHIFSEIVSENNLKESATCEHGAIYYKSCVCGSCDYFDTFEYGYGAHKLMHNAAVSSSCAMSGHIEYWNCSLCGRYYADGEGATEIKDKTSVELPLVNHSFTEEVKVRNTTYHVCEYCCTQENTDVRYVFSLNDDGQSYTLKGMYGDDVKGTVYLPSHYNGKPVTGTVGYTVFRGFGGIFTENYMIVDTKVTGVVIPDTMTEIGNYSFFGSTCLADIEIPDSVTAIGIRAFTGCVITEAVIPDSVTVFGQCIFGGCPLVSVTVPLTENITNIIGVGSMTSYMIGLPDTLVNLVFTGGKTISYEIFKDCAHLESITLPKSLSRIEYGAFNGCNSLTTVRYNGEIEDWCGINGLEYLMMYGPTDKQVIFSSGQPVQMTIPSTVTSIPAYAFHGFTSLQAVVIPDSVSTIGQRAFADCVNLTQAQIGDGVTQIGYGVFRNCNKLTSLTLPFVGSDAEGTTENKLAYLFKTNSNDYDYSVPETLKTVKVSASVGVAAFVRCSNITNVILNDGVIAIGNSAFSDCSSLTEIDISVSVTTIGSLVFNGCLELAVINYAGTIEQWNSIDKDANWNYYCGDYVVHCKDGDISKTES